MLRGEDRAGGREGSDGRSLSSHEKNAANEREGRRIRHVRGVHPVGGNLSLLSACKATRRAQGLFKILQTLRIYLNTLCCGAGGPAPLNNTMLQLTG